MKNENGAQKGQGKVERDAGGDGSSNENAIDSQPVDETQTQKESMLLRNLFQLESTEEDMEEEKDMFGEVIIPSEIKPFIDQKVNFKLYTDLLTKKQDLQRQFVDS